MSTPVAPVNSGTLITGPTGSGKSALLATFAEYLHETWQAVLLLYTTDGGGFPSKVGALVRQGLIRPWRLRTRGEAFETCMRASAGWWPSRIKTLTGEVPPNVRLVPPMLEQYMMYCPNGHLAGTVRLQSQLTMRLCPTCKVQVTRENMRVEHTVTRTPGFEKVGGVAYDGISSMLSWMMTDMARRHGNLELKGEESALGGRIVSGEIALGGNNRSHYGFVQSRAEEMVGNSNGIPGLLLPPIWTALMLETTDEGGLPVKGPKLAGKAKTDEAGAWFGNALEIGVVKDEHGNDVRRLSLSEFIDDGGVRHLVKHRGSPDMPPYLQDPHGQPWQQVNLGVFFQLLEADTQRAHDAAQARYGQTPVAESEWETYGDPTDASGGTGATGGATDAPTPAASGTPATPAKPPVAPMPKPRGRRPATAAVATSASASAPATESSAPAAQDAPLSEAPAPTEAPQEAQEAQDAPAAATTSAPSVTAPVAAPATHAPPAAPAARPSGARAFAPPPAPRPPLRAPRPPLSAPRR